MIRRKPLRACLGREQEVARLVASGMTNRQAAQAGLDEPAGKHGPAVSEHLLRQPVDAHRVHTNAWQTGRAVARTSCCSRGGIRVMSIMCVASGDGAAHVESQAHKGDTEVQSASSDDRHGVKYQLAGGDSQVLARLGCLDAGELDHVLGGIDDFVDGYACITHFHGLAPSFLAGRNCFGCWVAVHAVGQPGGVVMVATCLQTRLAACLAQWAAGGERCTAGYGRFTKRLLDRLVAKVLPSPCRRH